MSTTASRGVRNVTTGLARRCVSSASPTSTTACPVRFRVASSRRVALARALAPEPGVVLLDEPFASLDAALRVQLRDEVRRLLTDVGVTAILVTHDQEEAMSFGDRVAVMHAGLVEQVGTPQEIYTTPASPRLARFIGEAVLLPAVLNGRTADTALGMVATRPTAVSTGTVMLRPEQMSALPGGEASVTDVHYFGAETRYEISCARRDHTGCRARGRRAASPNRRQRHGDGRRHDRPRVDEWRWRVSAT